MANKQPEDNAIWSEVVNYLSTVPCRNEQTKQEFVTVSFEAKEGEITQIAFSINDSEALLAGLIESLSSQGNPIGMLLLDAIREAAPAAVEEDVEENNTDSDENELFSLDGDDSTGDDFGPDA